jgi:hypothetical protein
MFLRGHGPRMSHRTVAIVALVAAVLVLLAGQARTHNAPSGGVYPSWCCDERDGRIRSAGPLRAARDWRANPAFQCKTKRRRRLSPVPRRERRDQMFFQA